MSKTLSNGFSMQLAINEGQRLRVAWRGGSYTATIVAGGAGQIALATNAITDNVFGPYTGGRVIRLTCSPIGSVDYEVGYAAAIRSASDGLEIVGLPGVGNVLSAVFTGQSTGAVQWYRDVGAGPVAISGATSLTYTQQAADIAAVGVAPYIITCRSTALTLVSNGIAAPYVPSTSFVPSNPLANTVYNGADTSVLRALMARPASGLRTRILLDGDSTTTGAGAGTNTGGATGIVGARAKNWGSKLAAALTTAGYPTFNESIMADQLISGSGETYAAYDPRLVMAGGFAADPGIGALGGRLFKATASGATWDFTPTMTFDKMDIFTTTTPGGGAVTVVVDGVDGQVISGVAAVGILKTTITVPRGTHTIRLRTNSATTFFILGAIPYDSTIGGIDLVQAGWWGAKTADAAVTTSAWSPSGPQILAALSANLSIIQLGINDWRTGVTPATHNSNLTTIANARATAGMSVIIMSAIPSNTTAATQAAQDAVTAQTSAVAAARSSVFVDLNARSVNYAALAAKSWMFDDIHGNEALYTDEGTWMSQILRNF